MNEQHLPEDNANDDVGQVLRKAGRGPVPSAAATQQAYAVVHAAWSFEQRGRSHKRYAAIAASVMAIVAATMWMFKPSVDASPIAQIIQTRGEAVRLHGARDATPIKNGAVMVEGDELYSGATGRVVLQRASGLNVVLGANTRVQWRSHDDLRLIAGSIYVDTGLNAAKDNFTVATDAGAIRHVGTQFTVVARGDEVRVAVRQGSVRVNSRDRSATVVHGERAVLLKNGEMLRDQVNETSGAWNWLSKDEPQFGIEDRTLFDVLTDIADASGTRVSYASSDIEQQAKQLKLHGPALNLAPDAALQAVLLTTNFAADRTAQSLIVRAQ